MIRPRSLVAAAALAPCLLLAGPGSGLAGPHFVGKPPVIARIGDAVALLVDDDSEEGCVLRAGPVEHATEALLRRAGLGVDPDAATRVVVGVQSFRGSDRSGRDLGCVSSVQYHVIQSSELGTVLVYVSSDLMVSGGDNADLIRQSVQETTEDFLTRLEHAREKATLSSGIDESEPL